MKKLVYLFVSIAFGLGIAGCGESDKSTQTSQEAVLSSVPAWASDVVWYQIFPERFRNGDPSNDPIRESIEFYDQAPLSWRVSNWTEDWYKMDEWEQELGDFYDPSVFMRRYGGDIQGVIDGLPYLDSLGVTGLYFNPVFYARSMHKYDANSFHHIDPYFGPDPAGDLELIATETNDPESWHWTAADTLFLAMLSDAHSRGIRVIIDGVFNHSGRDFFAFDDLRRNQEASRYKDWYIVKSFDDPATEGNEFSYKGWWDVDTLPEFSEPDGDDLHPEVKEYVFQITQRWMDPDNDGDPSDGIDGWRLDVTEEVPVGFWQDWNEYVRSLNPDAYTVTEIWGDAHEWVQEGGFSATLNYFGFGIPVHDYFVDGRLSTTEFVDHLDDSRGAYPSSMAYVLQNLTDSHDTDRLASMIVNADDQNYDRDNSARYSTEYEVRAPSEAEIRKQRMIGLFQMTYVGAPMIYYGTESGMWGGDDPDDRKPMVWPDLQYSDERLDPRGHSRTPDPVRFSPSHFDYYQSLIELRDTWSGMLAKGSYRRVYADNDSETFAFVREDSKNGRVLVVMNRSEKDQTVILQDIPNAGKVVFTSVGMVSDVRLQSDSGALSVLIPAVSGAVVVLD